MTIMEATNVKDSKLTGTDGTNCLQLTLKISMRHKIRTQNDSSWECQAGTAENVSKQKLQVQKQ